MYRVVRQTPKNFDEKFHGKALVSLQDEYGGQSVIGTDDHCFVLYNGSDKREFQSVCHWHPEAATALQQFLNANPTFRP